MGIDLTNKHSVTEFERRHIGPSKADQQTMFKTLGISGFDELVEKVVPSDILRSDVMDIEAAKSEVEALAELKTMADKNKVYRSFIGQGYYDTHTPNVILRNIFENPGWYTSYTPYQPEISQGRLEALMNFQTMVANLTGFDIANASMLDEATAAAEAMTFCQRAAKSKANGFFVDKHCHPQTISVVKTRAKHHGIELIIGELSELKAEEVFGALFQYPNTHGDIIDFRDAINLLHENKAKVAMATDLLALTLLVPPAELGADVAIGSSQRFGVPLGFGGPHAAFMACPESEKRNLPGRIVGVSIDSYGKPAYRLALQTREQHIRRDKASSNICTAQALLAIMAGFYAVYHGPAGLLEIAERVASYTETLKVALQSAGLSVKNQLSFDTLTVETNDITEIKQRAEAAEVNLYYKSDNSFSVSIDEVTTLDDIALLLQIITGKDTGNLTLVSSQISNEFKRQSDYLTHPVFAMYRSETEMMRYMRKLSDCDLALDRTMIPLGSCTMKLNAVAEMLPVSWPAFNRIHPFAPSTQYQGYLEMFTQLEKMLCECTGYDAMSLQPNAGSQGEYAGLLAINAYHAAKGQSQRNICLIPESAHGTNPASASLANMKVVVTKCNENGDIDLDDLRAKAEQHKDNLAAVMVTYPSTHGVFEEGIREVCKIIHDNGGQVYLDGANLAAQVGIAAPGKFGADVSHLNLHKTFAIPHGGGGPGVGPIGVKSHLAPYLPNHDIIDLGHQGDPVSAAPWGSASILPITWMYMKMMGVEGLKKASLVAILNANYIAKRLSTGYQILYKGGKGFVAHECIIDTREFKDRCGVSVDDIAKRLMDFGFHAPTMSFPVPGTLMIEPTESESLQELDRFCDAMLKIREEIDNIEKGSYPQDNNPLSNSPHTIADLTSDWQRPYSREEAVFPVESLKRFKYFTPVNRVDNVYGDRHLVCTCPPLSAWADNDGNN